MFAKRDGYSPLALLALTADNTDAADMLIQKMIETDSNSSVCRLTCMVFEIWRFLSNLIQSSTTFTRAQFLPPLMCAAKKGNIEIMKILLDQKVDPNVALQVKKKVA